MHLKPEDASAIAEEQAVWVSGCLACVCCVIVPVAPLLHNPAACRRAGEQASKSQRPSSPIGAQPATKSVPCWRTRMGRALQCRDDHGHYTRSKLSDALTAVCSSFVTVCSANGPATLTSQNAVKSARPLAASTRPTPSREQALHTGQVARRLASLSREYIFIWQSETCHARLSMILGRSCRCMSCRTPSLLPASNVQQHERGQL